MDKDERDFYTRKEVADRVGVSVRTIDNWIKKGLFEAYRLGGRIRIKKSAWDSFIKESNA